MKIHGRAGIEAGDVGDVAAHVARGQIESAAQGDAAVSEIAAYAVATLDDVVGGDLTAAGAGSIVDVFVEPVADRLNTSQPVGMVTELLPGEIAEAIAIAVAGGQGVAE